MCRDIVALIAVLGFAAGPLAAQASVSGRWHMRLSNGAQMLRADLRLEQRGNNLTGTLALESNDGPPVAIRAGRIGAGGELEFAVDAPEAMSFTGRRSGASLVGQSAVDRGRPWQWSAERLADGAEFYAALPRFRAVQLTLGSNRTELRLPAAWVQAADRESGPAERADALATAAGVTPIPADSVADYGFFPSLGLARRDEMVVAMERALVAIRADLPPAEQPQFDALFRPRGTWLVDLHAAALDAARRRFRALAWEDARPALAAAGLLPVNLPPGISTLPLALYQLAVLRERDSVAFQAAQERMLQGGSASAQMSGALLDGYRDGAAWQGQAVAFLLSAKWVQVDGRGTSPAGLVRTAWGRPDLPPPAIRPRFFGIPDAVPRVGIPGEVVGRIVIAENWAAGQWAERRGPGAVLDVLRRLQLGVGPNTTLEADGPSVLTSVARVAAATPAGFLESTDAIIEDPGAPPLFAVATALHEWQHLLMERYRLMLGPEGALRDDGAGLRLVTSDLFLAEGLAEWMTERLLAPVLARTPIVGVGDAQKLTALAAVNPADPHVLGLRMMRALAAAAGSADSARSLVLAHADDPARVAAAVPAWRDAATPAVAVPVRGQRRLVPETIFTVEDGVGDVIGARIRILADTTAN
jgi:hypothetical protein